MKCFLCGGKAYIKQHKGRNICNKCFCKLLEKRIRKYSRLNKLFKKNDRIFVKGEINKYFVKSILKDLPVKFVRKKEKANKIVSQWTLEDEINKFLKALFESKKLRPLSKKYVKLLLPATDKEIQLFSKIKKIKFKPNKKDSLVQKFLDSIEKKHPNIKYNLLKNVNMLNRLTQNV